MFVLWCAAHASALDREAAFVAAHEELESEGEAGRILKFDDQGRVKPRAAVARAAAFSLDTVAAYVPSSRQVMAGIGATIYQAGDWRVSLQAASGGIGAGLAWRALPVVELTIGAGMYWNPVEGDVRPGAFVTLARW